MNRVLIVIAFLVLPRLTATQGNPCVDPIGFQTIPPGGGVVFTILSEHTTMEIDGVTPRVGEYVYALFPEFANPDTTVPVQGPSTVPKSAFTLQPGTLNCYLADLPAQIPSNMRLVAALKANGPGGVSGWSPVSNPFASSPSAPLAPGKPAVYSTPPK